MSRYRRSSSEVQKTTVNLSTKHSCSNQECVSSFKMSSREKSFESKHRKRRSKSELDLDYSFSSGESSSSDNLTKLSEGIKHR